MGVPPSAGPEPAAEPGGTPALAFRDLGAGPPVLLVHGQPGEGADWDPVIDLLGPTHRLVVPDRPGYGASPGPASGPTGNADRLADLLESLATGPAIVVGHSYGAAVAARLAERHPEAAAALVLVCPAASSAALGGADRALAVPVVGEAAAFFAMRFLAGLAHWATRVIPAQRLSSLPMRVGLPADRVGAFADSWRRGDVWRVFAAEQRALVAEMPELDRALSNITVPVSLVGGGRDHIIPPRVVRELAARLPQATITWAPEAGHLLPWRQPSVVAEAVRAMGLLNRSG
ncbi:MAG: alpha/beta fold hydrolase [Acidimicrobiales bacterium]